MPTTTEMQKRAAAIAKSGGVNEAIRDRYLEPLQTMNACEALIVGLVKQNVRKFLVVLGHGSTDIGEVLRVYSEAGVTETYNFRNECEMAHAATALRWQYGEVPALVTSIGPGAMLALAGSLTAITNGVGVYHIYGDETTLREGYNFQQIRKKEQQTFAKMTAIAGESYFVHTPAAMRDVLRRGAVRVNHPNNAGPFYIHMPMNIQPAMIQDINLAAFPERPEFDLGPAAQNQIEAAADVIARYDRVVIKAGGGARSAAAQVRRFAESIGATVVISPISQGLMPDAHPNHMHISGTKGTLSGNYAAAQAELVIVIGSRAVCQTDCSGIGYTSAKEVININAEVEDVSHYNRTTCLIGDVGRTLEKLGEVCAMRGIGAARAEAWLKECGAKKKEWADLRARNYANATRRDEIWQREVLTQPAALKAIVDFAKSHNITKLFDAGDVQSNSLQVCEDDEVGQSISDGGASFMGFGVSGLVASAIADNPNYTMAISGDGSFWMNPQALIDGLEHGVNGALVVLDNRRMSSITGLQRKQYGAEFQTSDSVAVDYRSLCRAISGLHFVDGGTSPEELRSALAEAHAHKGLSLVHVPVVWDHVGSSSVGTYGRWNIGVQVEDVEREYRNQVL
ncbi:thiamine pyrophosphate-binding protein [Mesorhizobium sp. B2-3-5]|nr:thiamine pyrophosphate-binding protein [Mesorhizobium sp. B2-3-5]